MSQHRILIVISETGFAASATTDTGSPVPLNLQQFAEYVPAINAEALAEIETIKAAHATEIATLQAQLAAATSPPASPPILDQLATVFDQLDLAIQRAFAKDFAIVRTLIQAGRTDLAVGHIEDLKIPAELEPVREAILAKLNS